MLKNLAFCGTLPPSCGGNMAAEVAHRRIEIFNPYIVELIAEKGETKNGQS